MFIFRHCRTTDVPAQTTRAQTPRVPATALLPYLLSVFVLAWGLFALLILLPEHVLKQFGDISASHPGFILAVYSPALTAVAIVWHFGGTRGLKAFSSRLLLWRCPPAWYGYMILGIPLIYAAGAASKGNLFTDPLPFNDFGSVLGAMAFMLVLGPIEEFGWRGVALPLLQRRYTPFASALILGLIWGAWHLPAFFLSGTPQSAWGFTPFLIGAVSLSVIMTPLFNASRGSILLAILFHFQTNNPLWPDAQPYDTPFFVFAALVVVWLNRRTMFTRAFAITEIIPGESSSASTPNASGQATRSLVP